MQSIAEHEKKKQELQAKYEAEKKALKAKYEAEEKAKKLAAQKKAFYEAQMDKLWDASADKVGEVWDELELEKKQAEAAWAEIEKEIKTAA